MALLDCSSIRHGLLSYIEAQTDVMEIRDSCVVTLPFKTIDDRWVDVYVEKRQADFYLVHDAGKTLTELLSHGLNMTESKIALLTEIAARLGSTIKEGSFIKGCKIDGVQEAILAIGQCASLGTLELLKHSANYEQVPLTHAVGAELNRWAEERASIVSRVNVQGASAQHTFDFVCYPLADNRQPIAVNILKPSYTPMSTARLYGFTVFDLARSKEGKWKKLAVLANANEWTEDSMELVRKHASEVVAVGSPDLSDLVRRLPSALDVLAA